MKLVFFTTFFLISAVTHAGLELIESKCCRCHRPGKEKGGLDLKSIMSDGHGHLQSPQKWERALAYLKSHEMPPQDSKAITIDDRLAMSTWLENNLIKTYL